MENRYLELLMSFIEKYRENGHDAEADKAMELLSSINLSSERIKSVLKSMLGENSPLLNFMEVYVENKISAARRLYYNLLVSEKGINQENIALLYLYYIKDSYPLVEARFIEKTSSITTKYGHIESNIFLDIAHLAEWQNKDSSDVHILAMLNFFMGDYSYCYYVLNNYIVSNKMWVESVNASNILYYYWRVCLRLDLYDSQILDKYRKHILSRPTLSDVDYYYLALIDDIKGDDSPIENFEKSSNKWSQLCLKSAYLKGNERDEFIKTLKLKRKGLSAKENLYDQLQDYIHINEVAFFVDDENVLYQSFYDSVYLKIEDKGVNGNFRREISRQNLICGNKLINKIIEDEKGKSKEIIDKELFYLKKLLDTTDPYVRDEFEHVDFYINKIDKKEIDDSIENQIALTIEKHVIDNDDYYLMIIWYFYHLGKISFEERTDLCYYLTYIHLKKKNENFIKNMKETSRSLFSVGITLSKFPLISFIIPLCQHNTLELVTEVYENIFNEQNNELNIDNIKLRSEYRVFKEAINHNLISVSNARGYNLFEKQNIQIDYWKKLNQIDAFLRAKSSEYK